MGMYVLIPCAIIYQGLFVNYRITMEIPPQAEPQTLPLHSRIAHHPHGHLSPRASLSPSALPIPKRQLQALNLKIRHEVMANRRRFQKLLTLNPYFTMKLLAPSNSFTPEECHGGSIGKMMRQLDLLLEEGNLLEKEIKKAELRRMQVDHQDPSLRDQLKHHFAFLRRLWIDPGREEAGSLDRLQELNKRVVIIKNGILAASDHQKKRHQLARGDHYEGVERRAKQTIRESEEYRRLKESLETACMRLQEKEARMGKICQLYQEKILEKQRQNQRWRRETEQLRKNNLQLKQKILSCELKETRLSERILHLQGQLLKGKSKPTQQQSLKENAQLNDNLSFVKETFVNQIKFRKMDMDPVRRNNFDMKLPLSDKVLPETTHQNDNEQAATSHSLPENKGNCPQQEQRGSLPLLNSPASIPKGDDTHTLHEGLHTTRQSRSIDGKKGRFTRMRSPANGKLIKPKGEDERKKEHMECMSPRLKELREDGGESLAGPKACQL